MTVIVAELAALVGLAWLLPDVRLFDFRLSYAPVALAVVWWLWRGYRDWESTARPSVDVADRLDFDRDYQMYRLRIRSLQSGQNFIDPKP